MDLISYHMVWHRVEQKSVAAWKGEVLDLSPNFAPLQIELTKLVLTFKNSHGKDENLSGQAGRMRKEGWKCSSHWDL